jgi:cell fate (sporulation/competence/biofilm development) regulator YlbF (YheA/YmcA/DUF963 family)
MDAIAEKAREVGRLLSRAEEYQALKRANERISDDRETVALLNQISELQERITMTLQSGSEPTPEQQSEYETLATLLQGRPAYQSVAAAQANFDRLMMRVNEEIAHGIEAGEQSRIIFPS